MPQVLPVLQEAAVELGVKDKPPFPATRAAKVEICFLTCSLWHLGQVTSSMALALRSSSSNGSPQSSHTNSKIGMILSWNVHCYV
jgi:hypothetical protein